MPERTASTAAAVPVISVEPPHSSWWPVAAAAQACSTAPAAPAVVSPAGRERARAAPVAAGGHRQPAAPPASAATEPPAAAVVRRIRIHRRRVSCTRRDSIPASERSSSTGEVPMPSLPLIPKRRSTTHVEMLHGELCIYEWTTKTVHALNPAAARVWEMCNGRTTIDEMTAALESTPGADLIVRHALAQFERAGLLEEESVAGTVPLLSRRAMLGRVGIAAAIPV